MKMQPLSISGDIFRELRQNIDGTLQMLVRRMISTRIDQGTVTAKIGIEIVGAADAGTGEIQDMPKITFNVTMAMSQKEGIKGAVPLGIFLKRDDETGILMIGDNQVSMDEIIQQNT